MTSLIITENKVTGEFKTPLAATRSSNTFSNVTILSRGIEAHPTQIDKQFQNLANSITTTGNGLVLQYDFIEGKWYQNTRGGKNYTIPNDIYGKPLVLVPGLDSREENIFKHGLAEAAGDRLFTSLVQLDQSLGGSVGQGNNIYDATGKLIRKPGAIFKSPLHFIGFGQGATINSEAIQRLGTFFPNAYDGSSSGDTPDLQMTTIDTPDPTQTLTKKLYDPEIKIWENVTFADNYYQKATFNGNTVFSGLNLADADLNVFLGEPSNSESRTGFTVSQKVSPHNRALGWYAGTANLSQQTFPSVVKEEGKYTEEVTYRRLGDLELDADGKPKTPTWYTPDYFDSPFKHGAENATWEGISTGWFYSANGGGKDLRHPQLSSQRSPVSYDNTNINHPDRGEKVRGDYTVPTLFNGNFEAMTTITDSYIPGWSFNNSTTGKNVVSFPSDKKNRVLKLESGKGEKITHNPFIIPESGDLRFDLRLATGSLGENNRLNVSLNPMNPKDGKGVDQTIFLTEAEGTLGAYKDDRFKIGYKPGEYETFHIDIPKELRGKPATLSFKLESLSGSDIKVYLDDVFFGSELLKLANPTEARPDSKSGQYNNNYLIEKPQYVLSYNNQKHTPNWVSWEVNKSWLSEEEFDNNIFTPDPELKETGWYQVKHEDYNEDKLVLPDGFKLERGHLTAAEDRTRSEKDYIATYLTTNILPQHLKNNRGPWKALEGHLRSRAKLGSDFTVFAGGAGTLADFPSIKVGDEKKTEIQVPSHIWKVVITRNFGDPIDLGLDAYAVIMPNENIAGQEWTEYRYSIQQLQDWLALDPKSPKYLDFLSGIKDDAQRNKLIKANKNSSPPPALT